MTTDSDTEPERFELWPPFRGAGQRRAFQAWSTIRRCIQIMGRGTDMWAAGIPHGAAS